jgi:hypothetical protein
MVGLLPQCSAKTHLSHTSRPVTPSSQSTNVTLLHSGEKRQQTATSAHYSIIDPQIIFNTFTSPPTQRGAASDTNSSCSGVLLAPSQVIWCVIGRGTPTACFPQCLGRSQHATGSIRSHLQHRLESSCSREHASPTLPSWTTCCPTSLVCACLNCRIREECTNEGPQDRLQRVGALHAA